jgi:hypothetical protein
MEDVMGSGAMHAPKNLARFYSAHKIVSFPDAIKKYIF